MTEAYPKKYWWIVLVALPLVLALVALLPDFLSSDGGGGDGSDGNRITITGSEVGGDVQIIGSQVIYQQLSEGSADSEVAAESEAQLERAYNLLATGFYEDAVPLFEALAKQLKSAEAYNNLGALYLATGQSKPAQDALREGLALEPDSEPLRLNLARLYEQQGKLEEAKTQLTSVADSEESRQRLKQLAQQSKSGVREQEPNNEILSPNLLPLGDAVSGALESQADVDFYRFTSPAPPRDILIMELRNLGIALGPRLQLWNADKGHLWSSTTNPTRGQDLQHQFSAGTDAIYYVSVHSQVGAGKYQLSVSPLKLFDSFEPNDTILSATAIKPGSKIDAAVLDGNDADFYRLNSGLAHLRVELFNLATNLRPRLHLWDAGKRHLWSSTTNPTAGQDLATEYGDGSTQIAYVSVTSQGGGGAYQLLISAL